jgi:hypothetical protein
LTPLLKIDLHQCELPTHQAPFPDTSTFVVGWELGGTVESAHTGTHSDGTFASVAGSPISVEIAVEDVWSAVSSSERPSRVPPVSWKATFATTEPAVQLPAGGDDLLVIL